MKKNILFLIVGLGTLLGLGSCSSYYYSFISSEDAEDLRNLNNDFVQDNDTVSVIYSFYGENAPIQITVHNKLNEPLYVDWSRSAIIIDDVATGYSSDMATFHGGVKKASSGVVVEGGMLDYVAGSTNGVVVGEVGLPREVTFIPPNSRITNIPVVLDNFSFNKIPNKEYEKFPFVKKNSELVNLKRLSFTESNSPLSFRSVLTVYTEERNGSPRKDMLLERSFYISQVVKAGGLHPSNLNAFNRQDGDCFYVQHRKGENTGMVLGVIAISAAGIALEVAFGPSEY